MADDAGGGGLVPVTDEQAKALQEAFKLGQGGLETARAFGRYLAQILGTLPQDLVGILGGDWIRARRVENMINLASKAQERLEARHVEEPDPVPLAVGIPLLTYASDENREELVDLWARLLAAAMDPTRAKRVRQTFIDAIKAMDPVDALILNQMPLDVPRTQGQGAGEYLSRTLSISRNEAQISFERLIDLRCLRDRDGRRENAIVERPVLTAFGEELLAVLQD